jgi:DNA-3-methyladenine glycosylase
MEKLGLSFYEREDVVNIARELIGKLLVTNFNGQFTSGRIVETEAYKGVVDKASHAYAGRRTKRTEIMFGEAAHAYVYLCYGIHHLFNVVTNLRDTPHAVLIRGIEPIKGIDIMLERMNKSALDNTVGKGPGNVSKALGITTAITGHSLLNDEIFLAADDEFQDEEKIRSTTRVGVAYAAEDALLTYRFYVEGNRYVSSPPKKSK